MFGTGRTHAYFAMKMPEHHVTVFSKIFSVIMRLAWSRIMYARNSSLPKASLLQIDGRACAY